MLINLKSKNIIITGGTSGLGLEIAKFLEPFNNVFIIGNKNSKKIKNLNKFKNSNIFKTDLTNSSKTEKIFRKINHITGKIDIILCFAGNSKPVLFKYINSTHWLESFKCNFLTATNTIENYDKVFKKKKTKIILISSICAQDKLNCSKPYSMSKSALNFYCKNVSKDYSEKGIFINTISLGNIYNENGLWGKKLKKNKAGVMKSIKENVPLKRFGKISELYNIIEYLCSEKSSFHLGSNFIMDGGQIL